MKNLIGLFEKKSKNVIGLMSGTSVDGIDAALVEITGSGFSTQVKLIDFITADFPPGFKEYVLKNSLTGSGDVADICKLNFLIAKLYANAVKELCVHSGVSLDKIDLIGSHGQTVHHLPQPEVLFGQEIRSTLQIGDPSVLAKLTGVITVGDFRVGDVALGGQGAPLVPYFDFLLF
ncbi:MAG: anhydro-N-acetylmuramic acid kinase, partial [Candidatus Kryptoniota bacterium]